MGREKGVSLTGLAYVQCAVFRFLRTLKTSPEIKRWETEVYYSCFAVLLYKGIFFPQSLDGHVEGY